MKKPQPFLLFLAIFASTLTVAERPVQATPRPTITLPQTLSLNFVVPRRGAPTSTAGGATRGSCKVGTPVIAPILPQGRLGLTLAERPSFFVYIPPGSAETANFLLQTDGDREIVYESDIKIPAASGIVRFDLPADAPALEVGKQYHWFITLKCNPIAGTSGNPGVDGWVERIAPDATLARQLQNATPKSLPALYAGAGIWHEALSSLVTLRQQAPDNAQLLNDWQSLLKSVGLDSLTNEPLVKQSASK